MSDVPDEILREILSRLPVAPLLRFRCVSKSWKGLIDNQQFIKHHLNHSRTANSHLNIILDSRPHLYSADFDLLNETNMATFKQLSQPLKTPFDGTKILGSCDGLLVLRNEKDGDLILWNPSVRRFHEIPFGGIKFPESLIFWDSIVYGFGYDVVSDDYKLVRIAQFHGKGKEDFKSKVKVYSLKSNSWREIPDFPYYIKSQRADVVVNGASHWIVGREDALNTDGLVAAFDLGTEEYRLVPLPKFACFIEVYMILGVVGGCLSIMYYNENKDNVDVWVMKEYGVQESWSILFAIDIWDMNYLRLIAYSKCGRKVLLRTDERDLMWYDLDKKFIELPIMLQMPLGKTLGEMHICLQSLVMFNSGTCGFDHITKNIEKKEEQNDKILKKDMND